MTRIFDKAVYLCHVVWYMGRTPSVVIGYDFDPPQKVNGEPLYRHYYVAAANEYWACKDALRQFRDETRSLRMPACRYPVTVVPCMGSDELADKGPVGGVAAT
jgi:hypothetical protein